MFFNISKTLSIKFYNSIVKLLCMSKYGAKIKNPKKPGWVGLKKKRGFFPALAVLRLLRGSSGCLDVAPLGRYTVNGTILGGVTSQRFLDVLVDSTLCFHGYIASMVSKAGELSINLLRLTLRKSAIIMISLFVSHIHPLLDFASPVWNIGYLGDLHLLESVQRRWTKNIDGMTELSYAHRLEALNLYPIKGRLLRANLLKCWKIFHRTVQRSRSQAVFLVEPEPENFARARLR